MYLGKGMVRGMTGFDKDELWTKILSMYPEARENNYILKLGPAQVQELKAIFLDLYVPMEKLAQYDDKRIMKELMRAIVQIYIVDKNTVSNRGEIVELVNSVKYDGTSLYIFYAKISPIKMRRIELGRNKKQIAEKMGYGISTIDNCEEVYCDFTRQPDSLVIKLARALDWEPEQIRAIQRM